MFTVLTFFIVLLSYFLVREIKFFGHSEQSHVDERKAVVLTSVMFCSGFFIQIAKNATAFRIYIYDGKDNNQKSNNYVCSHMGYANLFNMITYFLENIVPIFFILRMHKKNF
jgi:hypothetical protein